MDTRRLQAFIKIVDLGTLRGAAEHLHLSQPSLTKLVKDLEADFNVTLLTRTKRGVRATAAGDLLYRHAQSVLRQLEQARSELSLTGDEIVGAVSVGMAGTIAPVLAVPLLARMQKTHPRVRLRIVEGSHAQMAELALGGRIDLAVSSGDPVRGLTGELFLREQLVLVCSEATSRSLGAGPLSITDFGDLPFVLPTRMGLAIRSRYHDLTSEAPDLNVIAELDSAYDLIRAVEDGLASTLIGGVAATQLATGLVTRPLARPLLERELHIWESSAFPASTPAQAVKATLKSLMADMGTAPS